MSNVGSSRRRINVTQRHFWHNNGTSNEVINGNLSILLRLCCIPKTLKNGIKIMTQLLVVKKPSRFARAKSYLQSKYAQWGVGTTVATFAVASHADTASGGYDVTSVLTNLGLAVSAAGAIGVAWLGFSAGISIWKNLRAAAK